MLSCGFRLKSIRQTLLADQIKIIIWGILTGVISALAATLPSLNSGNIFPLKTVLVMLLLISAAGIGAVLLVISGIKQYNLVSLLRKE